MVLLGLLGHPVGHSLSKVMHEAALADLGLEGRYDLHDVLEPGLDAFIANVREGRVTGYNVTVPHKRAVALRCDALEPSAAALGAVNTIVRGAAGEARGANTDLPGLVRAVRLQCPELRLDGCPACVIGAGGAARAAALAALELGAGEVRVVNRTRARAAALVAALDDPRVRVEDTPESGAARCGLLLQATTLGMGCEPDDPRYADIGALAERYLDAAADDAALVDLVYRPRVTAWVDAAQRRGQVGADGLEMLVQQGALAFEMWTGRAPRAEVMRDAALAAFAPE